MIAMLTFENVHLLLLLAAEHLTFFPLFPFSLSRSLALLLLIIYASVIGSGSQITFNCLSLNSSNCFAEQEYPAVI